MAVGVVAKLPMMAWVVAEVAVVLEAFLSRVEHFVNFENFVSAITSS